MSSDAYDRRDGRLFRIEGGSQRTVIQLDLPTNAPSLRNGLSKDWWHELRTQRRMDRTIEIRITMTLVEKSSDPSLPRGANSSDNKWPLHVFFDAELDRSALHNFPNSDKSYPSSSSSSRETVRYEKELIGLNPSQSVNLIIKPEFTTCFMQQSLRIVFRGHHGSNESYMRIRASPWERMTLPALFDPSQDSGHLCIVEGQRLCQPVNLLSDVGVGGRHFEWVPLDSPAESVALALARAWHATMEEARSGRSTYAPQPSSTPRTHDGDGTYHTELAQLSDLRLYRSGPPSSRKTPRALPPPQVRPSPHAADGFDLDWERETNRQQPLQLEGLHLSTRSNGPTGPMSTADDDDEDPFSVHIMPPAPSPPSIAAPAPAPITPRRSPASTTTAAQQRHADDMQLLRASPGGGRLLLPPLSTKRAITSPHAPTPTAGVDTQPTTPRPHKPDLRIHIASTPMANTPQQATQPVSAYRPPPSTVAIQQPPSNLPRPPPAVAAGFYDPFAATYAPQVEHQRGMATPAYSHTPQGRRQQQHQQHHHQHQQQKHQPHPIFFEDDPFRVHANDDDEEQPHQPFERTYPHSAMAQSQHAPFHQQIPNVGPTYSYTPAASGYRY